MTTLLDKITLHTLDDAGCLVWQRGCCNGHPAMRHNGGTQLVRRLLWTEVHGPIPPGRIVRMACETPLCVNPDCMTLTTYQKLATALGAMGIMSGTVRSAKIAAAKRAAYGKLTTEAVHDIRTSNATGVAMAAKYGICEAKISQVRRHQVWRDYSANPFTGLGART